MLVLATADIHIGRRSTRLPEEIDGRSTSSAAAWGAIVDLAIARSVDVVAIAGDLVDHDNRFYEALGPLERGLRRLGEAGIDVVAVAGNHDYDVLPSLARSLPDGFLRLVGAGGQWERIAIERGQEQLFVDGWSFPTRHVREAPLDSYSPSPLLPEDGAPLLGMLHGDLDVPTSSYAPIALGALHATPASFWLLGHVHRPGHVEREGAPTVLYPGSPNPMDPGESGAHGVWMLDFGRGNQRPKHTFVPLARVRYDALEVDLTDVSGTDALRQRITSSLRARAADLAEPPLEHLVFRLRLTGRSPLHRSLQDETANLRDDLHFDVNGVEVHVERVDCETRAVRDLAALTAGSDAAAWLAGLITALEAADTSDPSTSPALPQHANGGGYEDLLRELGTVARTVRTVRGLDILDDSHVHIPDQRLRTELGRQAELLLDELLSQREGAA